MDNRNLMIAALLSAAVLVFWTIAFPPPPPVEPGTNVPPGRAVATEASEASGGETGSNAEPASAGSADETSAESADMPVPADASPVVSEPIVAEGEERPELEAEFFRAEFSNRGAQLVSLELKDQRDREGAAIDLVRRRGEDPYPMALLTPSGALHPLNSALWVVESQEPSAIVFRHRSEKGDARKEFHLDERGLLRVSVRLEGGSRDWGLLLGPGLRQRDSEDDDDQFIQREASYSRGGDAEEYRPGKLDEPVEIPGSGLRWVALEDNHFLSALLPRSGVARASVRPVWQREEIPDEGPRFLAVDGDDAPEGTLPALLVVLEAEGPQMEFEGYFGAKRYDYLAGLELGLEETVRWGMLGWLSRPLYYGLQWLHARVVPNYGWAIVLLTLGIKLVFFPLTWRSQESMTKMQELNPKVQAIRNSYRSKLKDKQGRPNVEAQRQMNEEVMALYRTAGVNPVSGCLPMLLQIPVFFALYRLLATAAELRDAPWVLWIGDLASPDPYYALPLVMGATSLGMHKMMPSSPDPMQKRIMQMMPIMFTVFAFAFPAGLVLYWLTNNLLTMLQQWFLLRTRARREAGGSPGVAGAEKA